MAAQPVAAFGLAFLALTFSIVSNFVVTIGTICAERLMYLPSAGAVVAAGVAVRAAGGGDLPSAAPGRMSRSRADRRRWRGADVGAQSRLARRTSLWTAAVEVAPAQRAGAVGVRAHPDDARRSRRRRRGRTADAERLYAEAQAHFETAVQIYPSYSLPLDGLAMI